MLRRMIAWASLCVLVPAAAQADIRFDKKAATIHITGTIWDRDAGRLQTLSGSLGKTTPRFQLDSDGGDVLAAMRIGRIVRKLNGHTVVDAGAKCHSACALIFIGGVRRMNLGEIGLHRPYLDTEADQLRDHLPMLNSQVKDYVYAMGAGDSFFRAMMDTPSSTMAIYGPADSPALIPERAAGH